MESFSSMLDAFKDLNERKRRDPKSLSEDEKTKWKKYRREFEKVLFQAEPDPAADTREFLRVPVSLAVRYWTKDELKDRYIPVLGEGGLFVATVDPLEVGSTLDLEIVLAQKGLTFPIKGQVVWVNNGEDPAQRGMGVKFVELTYEQKRNIYNLVDDNLRQRLLERRRFARVDTKLHVQFVYAEGFFELKTEDLSLGGLFIATDHLVPVGEKVRLVLHIPGDHPSVKAVCEVVRVVEESAPGQPAGLGIRFDDMSDADLLTVRDYLGRRVAGQIEPGELERRRSPRIERLVKLRFQALDSFGSSVARDVSSGGVFIQTHEIMPIGTEIQVSLIHPVTLQQLDLVGRVVRVVEADASKPNSISGIGVNFEEVSEEKRAILREFLKDFILLDTEQTAIEGLDPDQEQ
ncbi:MAG: PilZ domain-containing protein [Deltaproteobacteria bacterium]|nr:PilZ domain-containing protein [Deltaproteobacteria bacterium]